MQNKQVDVMDHIGEIVRGVKNGVLLTTKRGIEVNCMTISWGQIGIEWNRLLFTTYVRTGRYTHKMLEDSGEFTVNIGMGGKIGKILGYCGTKSGADVNKIKELGLNLVTGTEIETPGIMELPLTLECRLIYTQYQDRNAIPEEFVAEFYPQNVQSSFSGANRDYHTMFYGEIIGAYIAGGALLQ